MFTSRFIFAKYIVYILYITYVNLSPKLKMYICHLFHASFILGTGRTAMTILVCEQWQKYKLVWKDGDSCHFKQVGQGRSHWKADIETKASWGEPVCQAFSEADDPARVRAGKAALRCECGWSDLVGQGGSMVGAQRGRGETRTQWRGAIEAILRKWAFLWMRRKTSGAGGAGLETWLWLWLHLHCHKFASFPLLCYVFRYASWFFLIDFQWVWHNILALVFCYPFTLPALFGSNNLLPQTHTLPSCLHKATAAFIFSLFVVHAALFISDVHMYSSTF